MAVRGFPGRTPTRALTSHQQGDDHLVVLALPQHLPFERHLPVFPGSHQDPHHLIGDPDVPVEQLSKGDAGLPVSVRVGHRPDHVAHVGYLAVDVLLGAPGPLGCLGSLFGASVTLLAFLEAEGHGIVVVKVFTERVEFLVHGVLRGPALPAALQVSHRAVLLGEGVDLVGILRFLFVPEKNRLLLYKKMKNDRTHFDASFSTFLVHLSVCCSLEVFY